MTSRLRFEVSSVALVPVLTWSAFAQTTPPNIVPAPQAQPAGAAQKDDKSKDEIPVIRVSEVRVSEFGTCDIVVQNDDITNVLAKLAVQARKNIVPTGTVSRPVNATMYGVPFEQALDALLQPNGLGYEIRGDFIYVMTADELALAKASPSNLKSKRINLDYLRSADAMEYVKPLLSAHGSITPTTDQSGDGESGAGVTVSSGGTATSSTSAQEGTAGIYTPDKDEFSLENAVIVHDNEVNLARIERFLKELDTQPAQVLIEATVIQVDLDEQNALGVDFALLNGVQFSSFFNFAGPVNGGVLNPGDTSGNSGPGFGQLPAFAGDDINQDFVVSSPGNTGSGPGTIKIGITDGNNVGFLIRALDQVTDVTLLSNPKVLALNRQRAKVLVGTRVGYLETVVVENQVLQTIKFIDTGVSLDIRPFVMKDGRVRMELTPKVSKVVFREFESTTGVTQQIPDEQIQTILTNVLVPQGHTAVLGGLFREDTSRIRNQVPLAGDIPLVGYAFQGQDDRIQRVEIIFLIKPVVMTDQLLASQGENGNAYYDHVRVGSRMGLLPWSRERQSANLNLRVHKAIDEGSLGYARWYLRRSLFLHPLQPEMVGTEYDLFGGAGFRHVDSEFVNDRSMLTRILEQEAAEHEAHEHEGSGEAPADGN